MKPVELMRKASRAANSAKLLLDAGDVEGACNRAYYAMFDAAQAALIESAQTSGFQPPKTHSGLISEFSRQFIKTGRLPTETGRVLNRISEIRLVADYTHDTISTDKAAWTIQQATDFIETIKSQFGL